MFTICYFNTTSISLLVVTQNAVLIVKRLTSLLFRCLSSSDTLFYYRNSGKASFAQVRSSKWS